MNKNPFTIFLLKTNKLHITTVKVLEVEEILDNFDEIKWYQIWITFGYLLVFLIQNMYLIVKIINSRRNKHSKYTDFEKTLIDRYELDHEDKEIHDKTLFG